ncbi:MAG: O-antigen ligase family protein [Pseudorhodoplanes sp.]
MSVASPFDRIDRARWSRLADGIAALTAISLPWSTSATSILLVVWIAALIPVLNFDAVRREVTTMAGGLPVLLWLLGACGMVWADATWAERLEGLGGFHKLLLIPLFLAQFRRSENVLWVIWGFFASCIVLLIVSALVAFVPAMTKLVNVPGVPVKDYIAQSAWFQLCLFGLLYRAFEPPLAWRRALMLTLLAAAFLADIVYVASSRTTFVLMPVLAVALGARRFGWKGGVAAVVLASLLAAALWSSSPYLRERLGGLLAEMRQDRSNEMQTSAGQRLEFWRKSAEFVSEAPAFGNGTGSISPLFRKATAGQTGAAGVAASNPHQQTFAVAIQIGLAGAAILWAMWIAHLFMFRAPGLVAWLGLVLVLQNIVGSLFNSHLFDFNQGWLYVIGVGVLGGAALRGRNAPVPASGAGGGASHQRPV